MGKEENGSEEEMKRSYLIRKAKENWK